MPDTSLTIALTREEAVALLTVLSAADIRREPYKSVADAIVSELESLVGVSAAANQG